MDTIMMIAELKQTCKTIESEKSSLLSKVKELDDRLTAYKMAIDSLELTVSPDDHVQVRPKSKKRKYKTRSDAKKLHFNGKSKTIAEWSAETGISVYTIRYRLNNGWDVSDILTRPVDPVFSEAGKRNQRVKPRKVFAYDAHGNVIRQFVGIGDASRSLNMPITTIEKIIEKMTKEDQLRVRDYYLAYVA